MTSGPAGAPAQLAQEAVGAVLCGGASSRMGHDKSLLPWDGTPMAALVAAALAAGGCAPVLAVGGDRAALEQIGLTWVADKWPGEGPLGGVLTALHAAAGRPVMVVACDMPFLTAASVAAVLAGLHATVDGVAVDVAVARTDRPQPLCAVWRASTRRTLESAFATGSRDLRGRIATLRAVEVAIPGQDARNINTPRDLAH